MTLTSFRRLAAGASAAALVSASAFFGSSAAFAQPTPEETETATESAVQSADTGTKSDDVAKKSEDRKQTAEKKSADPAETKPAGKPKPKASKEAEKKPAPDANEPTAAPGEDPSSKPSPSATPTDDPTQTTPEFDISATKISAETLREGGVAVTAKNLQPGDILNVKGTHIKAAHAAAENGTATVTAVSESSVEDLEAAGTITITALIAADGGVKRGEKNFEITIEKQDDGDDAPAFDPKVSSAPDEITAADLANPDKGISITASNLQPGDVVTNSLTNESETSEGDELVTGVYYEGDPSDFEVGDKVDFTVTVTREGEESKTFDFTVTIIGEDDGDDEKWEPELKVAPKKISVTDFRNENKGVKLELTGCYPGEIATFIIEQYEGDLSYETEVETDEHGTAVIEHIHGTGNAPDSAYIGEYHVIASCIDGEEEAYGDFSVHAGDDSKGGGDSDKGRDRDRNELPRTGSDLTALYGAAGLLAVGAAAMAVGRRKSTKK